MPFAMLSSRTEGDMRGGERETMQLTIVDFCAVVLARKSILGTEQEDSPTIVTTFH